MFRADSKDNAQKKFTLLSECQIAERKLIQTMLGLAKGTSIDRRSDTKQLKEVHLQTAEAEVV